MSIWKAARTPASLRVLHEEGRGNLTALVRPNEHEEIASSSARGGLLAMTNLTAFGKQSLIAVRLTS
jgi:hypothetical protein